MSTTVKGIDLPLIWKTWLIGSQASSKYYSRLICCLMLEMRKNFSKPQFRSAFTVTGSCREIISSSSCSRSHHVRVILLWDIWKTNKRGVRSWFWWETGKTFHQKLCNKFPFCAQRTCSSVPPALNVKLPSYWPTFNAGFDVLRVRWWQNEPIKPQGLKKAGNEA